jgi:hypothetical protein
MQNEQLLFESIIEMILNSELDVVNGDNFRVIVNELEIQNIPIPQSAHQQTRQAQILHQNYNFRNDSENVHDTIVNQNIKTIISLLKEEQKNTQLPPFENIVEDYFKNSIIYGEGKSVNYLETVIEVLLEIQNNENVHILGVSCPEIARRVWLRFSSADNVENYNNLKQSMFDMMYECFENGHMLCSTGIIHKIISSLTLLDSNKSLWDIKCVDYLKLELFDGVKKLVSNEYERLKMSDNNEVRKVAEYNLEKDTVKFLKLGKEINPNIDEIIKNEIQIKINKYFDAFTRTKMINVPSNVIEKIREGVNHLI